MPGGCSHCRCCPAPGYGFVASRTALCPGAVRCSPCGAQRNTNPWAEGTFLTFSVLICRVIRKSWKASVTQGKILLLTPPPMVLFFPPKWIFGAHSPVVGFSPSSSVEFVPVLPPVYTATVPPHAGKSWIDKRLPSCKVSAILACRRVFKAGAYEVHKLKSGVGSVNWGGV